MTTVQGVLAKQALLPCDVTPMDRDDVVFMVLWFKEGDGEPLYRYVYLFMFLVHYTRISNFTEDILLSPWRMMRLLFVPQKTVKKKKIY